MAKIQLTKCDGPNCKQATENAMLKGWIHIEITGGFMGIELPSQYDFCSYYCLTDMVIQWSDPK